jgi:ParB family chromosome partitioning protein
MAADTIVRVDPKTLLVGPNVRKDTKLTTDFVASVKELGVRIPITAYESDEGLVVVDGQRRTLAAVDAGLAEVPVFVTSAPSEQERLIDQVVVNEQRSDLFEHEAVAAVQELALFEMKAPAIAKKLGLSRDLVNDALRIRLSDAGKAVYEKHGQLDIAVAVAELEGQPEQAELVGLDQSWKVRERARELVMAKSKREVEDKAGAEGVTIVKAPDYYAEDPQPVRYLYTDKACKEGLDGMPHERIVELAGDGLVGWAEQFGGDTVIRYGVKGWAARGLHVEGYRLRGAKQGKPSTPEEAEKVKAERRVARETTKAWVAATADRIVWLQELVQRRTAPKGWEILVARRLVQTDYSPSQLRMVVAILQLADDVMHSQRSLVLGYLEKNPTKAAQVMLAVWAGAIEGGGDFDKKGWGGTWQVDIQTARAYLEQLAEWGFTLSEVEQSVVDGAKKGKKAA